LRIVLDTNVLISGIFFSGPPYEILKAWKEKRIQFVITAEIFAEYVRVAENLSNNYVTVNISEILTSYCHTFGDYSPGCPDNTNL